MGREKRVILKWLGEGAKRLDLPVPLLRLCEKKGEVVFNPFGEVPPEDAENILRLMPDKFERVNQIRRRGAVEKASEMYPVYVLSSKARAHLKKRQEGKLSVPASQRKESNNAPSPAEPEGDKELNYG